MFAPGSSRIVGPVLGIAVALAVLGLFEPREPFRGLFFGAMVTVLVVVAFLGWFFRDPERRPGPGVVSAADGRVLAVSEEGERWQVAVFMNVTDVHVNRSPVDARVTRVSDGGKGFRPAYRADADHNVRRSYTLETRLGEVEVVQRTGAVARRLVSFVAPGATLRKGDRFGMIVLGSRVDVFLPRATTRVAVAVGDRVRAGETTIAEELA